MSFSTKIILFILIVNALNYFAFWHDKRAAKKKAQRVPEKTLLILSFFGGSPAAFIASSKFRHKTKKQPFRTILYFIVFIQILAVILLINNSTALAQLEAYVS